MKITATTIAVQGLNSSGRERERESFIVSTVEENVRTRGECRVDETISKSGFTRLASVMTKAIEKWIILFSVAIGFFLFLFY